MIHRTISKRLLAVVAMAAMLAQSGCIKDPDYDCRHADDMRDVMFMPVMDNASDVTRGAAADKGGIIERDKTIPQNGKFGIYAYSKINGTVAAYNNAANKQSLQNTAVTNTGTTSAPVFTYTPTALWPQVAGGQLAFYGYYPHNSTNFGTGGPGISVTMGAATSPSMSIAYTCPTDPSKQVDLLWTYKGFMSAAPVSITFNHALTRISFAAAIESGLGSTIKITGITLKNVKTTGTLKWSTATDAAWSGLGTAQNIALTTANGLTGTTLTTTSTTQLTATGKDMVLIPQALTDIEVEITVTENGTPKTLSRMLSAATAHTWSMGGAVNYQIVVKQDDFIVIPEVSGSGNVDMKTYVGAFWRSTQRGERLISMTLPANPLPSDPANVYSGDWRVVVLDYGVGSYAFSKGDILFEKWTTALPSAHNQSGDVTALSAGTTSLASDTPVANGGTIKFKIGLKKTISASEHRYARVLVMFGTKDGVKYGHHRVIWLRQGETPDYLMEQGDLDKNGNPFDSSVGGRPNAAMWSPYNVTPSTWVTINHSGSQTGNYEKIKLKTRVNATYGGTTTGSDIPSLVAYPTMAGALFQWTGAASAAWERLAYNSGTLSTFGSAWQWNSLTDAVRNPVAYIPTRDEVCPVGYRRPTGNTEDKVEKGTMIGNNVWQSLAVTKDNTDTDITNYYSNGNSVYGYLADGYFDRYPMVESRNPNSSYTGWPKVMTATQAKKDVAYMGVLVYNDCSTSGHKNASLFFPTAGRREKNGTEAYLGSIGHYWTSNGDDRNSSTKGSYGGQLMISSRGVKVGNYSYKDTGAHMRCIYDPTYQVK